MKPDGHRARGEEIERTVRTLMNLDANVHVATIVEGAYGAAQHYIAYGMQRHVGHHVDGHVGLVRALNGAGFASMATLFGQMERMRAGYWYGGQAGGGAAQAAVDILEEIKRWSLT
jgi:hypothetical protein